MLQQSEKNSTLLYVCWSPENSPYTVELKLELAKQLAVKVRESAQSGMETGGVLFGRLPTSALPTLRIDAIRDLPRPSADGPMFLFDPKDLSRKLSGPVGNQVPIGMVRSHTRRGPLKPSLADRALLTGDVFGETSCLLLVEARERMTAALFIGSKGFLPDEPAIAPFRLDETELMALPEANGTPNLPPPRAESSSKTRLYVAGGVLALTLATAAYAWSGSPDFSALDHTDNPHLNASGDEVLTITWNRNADVISRALSGRLVIADGASRREVEIGADELKSGSVEYRHRNSAVQITLRLAMPGDFTVSQSIAWRHL